tara:strand:+ start:11063 stop:13114 length:2052 start_codon:yes stop_codon:yes gene_type:complete
LSKNLVIVESPTKAKTLQRFLGKEYLVEASIGHINNLQSGYKAKYTGPVVGLDEDFEPIWEYEKGAKTRIDKLSKLAKNCEKIYLAADPDREGEGIAFHVANALIEKGQSNEKFKRVVFHEITESAVKDAFEKAGKLNMDLVDAHIGRRLVDRLVGFSLSGLTSSLLRLKRLSVGRVQSVAVSIIKDKEDEINAFIPQEYWNITGDFSKNKQSYQGKLYDIEGVSGKNLTISNEAEAKNIQFEIEKLKYKILSIKSNLRKTKPRPPFTTSSLQQDASSRLRMAPSRTMSIAQQLFQGIDLGNGEEGLITYMRTDSNILSEDSLSQVGNFIQNNYGNDYHNQTKYKTKSANAQEAHEAIRPTSIARTPESIRNVLSEDQYKLYDLIWKRTVASQMAESQNKKTIIITSSENEKYKFISEYDELVFEGFKKLFPQKDSNKIPNIIENELVDLEDIIKEQKFTQHTPRYSEASLIKTMEELGVGRPSTYASILNTIKEKKYVWVINRSIYLSPVGNALVEELKKHFSESVMDYKFTEKMENDLDQISNGNLGRNEFIKSFWENFEPIKNNYEKIADENPRNPSEYNFLRTNIICSSKTPCINSETGEEFQENDPPLGQKSLDNSLEKLPRMIWIRFRNKKGDGGFLACEDRDCKVTADESAWAGSGRRRTRTIEALKKTMKEKCIH